MFNSKMLKFTTALLLTFSYIPISISVDYGSNITEERFKKADVVIVQMNDIRASVFTFYDENAALPANIGLLVDPNQIYYTGNTRSAFGTAFGGAISGDGRFFNVSVDLMSTEVAQYVALRLNTQSAGNIVTLSVGSPASSIVDHGFLARNFDPLRPTLSEMNTDLIMRGNDINDVNIINASRINIGDLATIDDLNVISTTTTLDFISTGSSTLNNTTVNGNTVLNTATVNGAFAINGGLAVNSIAEFNKEVNFNSTANVIGLLSAKNGLKVVNGIVTDTIVSSSANFTNTTSQNITSSGLASLKDVTAQNVTTSSLTVNNNFIAQNSLITGDQTVNGNSKLSTLDVAGNAIIRSRLDVLGVTNLDDLVIDGNTIANAELTAALGVFLGNGDAHIGQSVLNDSLRYTNTAGWVDIGNDASGIVTFETDGNGYTFDHKVKALGSGGSIELNTSAGMPEIVFSRLGRDVTFGLTSPSVLTLAGADLKTTNRIYARELFENNVSLSNKYLGINGKAKDSDKLDGYSSEHFALATHQHNKLQGSGYQSINLDTLASSVPSGALQIDQYTASSAGRPNTSNNANAVITVGQHGGGYTAQLAFSSDGSMYQRSNPGAGVGSWGKVWTSNNDGANSGLDADLLGGRHSSLYVATDKQNTFTQQQIFNSGIRTNSTYNYLYGKNELSSNQYDTSGAKARYAINMNNSDMVGVQSIHFKSSANSAYEGLLFPRSSSASNLSQYSSVRSYSGNLYFNPVANSTTYKLTDGVNVYENNVPISDKYLSKSDNSVMRISKSRSGTTSSSHYGMYAEGTDNAYIRAPRYGLLPWSSSTGNIGTSGWNFNSIYGLTIFEGNVALVNKYLGKSATAYNSDRLGGFSSSEYVRQGTDILISKSNPWLTLDSPSNGSAGNQQGAGISIGESGKKGSAALHLTYTGDGNSYIGMGAVNNTTGIPDNTVLKMNYSSKNAWFQGDIYEKGVKLEDKYALKANGSSWTLAWSGSEDRDVNIPGNHRLEGKEVFIVTSDENDLDEIATYSMYIPEESGFNKPIFFQNTWGKFEYHYINNRIYVNGDTGFRQVWYRDPVDIPNIGIVRR